MYHLRALLNIALLVTFFGAALSDQDDESATKCNFFGPMFLKVYISGNHCASKGSTPETIAELRRSKDIEGARTFFVSYCQRQSFVRECLEHTTKEYEGCYNATYVNAFNIYRGFLETILDLECSGDVIRLAKFWRGIDFIQYHPTEMSKIIPCYMRTLRVAADLEDSSVDIASMIFIFHKEMQWFKGCIYQLDLDLEFKGVLNVFLGEMINKMKCLNPQDGTFEPCDAIDVTLIKKTSACGVKTRDDEFTIYDAMEDDAGRCFDYILQYDQPQFSVAVGNEMIAGTCSGLENIFRCLDHQNIYSEMCMNPTQQHEFRILRDSMKTSFELGCANGGARIVNVLLEVYRLKRTGQGHAVWGCVDVAKSTRNEIDEHRGSSKNMRFYHEMAAFKTCLVGQLHGDPTSVDAATSLIDEMLGKVKCIHPEDGTTVLCETLGDVSPKPVA